VNQSADLTILYRNLHLSCLRATAALYETRSGGNSDTGLTGPLERFRREEARAAVMWARITELQENSKDETATLRAPPGWFIG